MGWDPSLDPTTAPYKGVLVAEAQEGAKPHWTQTPEGKKKMAAIARKKHANGGFGARKSGRKKSTRKSTRNSRRNNSGNAQEAHQEKLGEHIAYLSGRFEVYVDHYCERAGISRAAVAAGLAEFFRNSQVR